jgi:hypothetical protein
MEKRIADYKASGQTQAKWCESNDISIHQFRYWMKRNRDHLEQLPNMDLTDIDALDRLLPWSASLPVSCISFKRFPK